MLIAFDEPVGFEHGHRLVVSLDLPGGHFYALGSVVRTTRGDDFRTSAAIQFLGMDDAEFADLSHQFELLDLLHGRVPAG